MQIVARRLQDEAAAHPSFLCDALAGTNSNKNNDNYMRNRRRLFLLRFLDTGFPLPYYILLEAEYYDMTSAKAH